MSEDATATPDSAQSVQDETGCQAVSDPGQKDASAAQDVPMQQSTPSTAQSATSASAYEKFDAIDANRDGSIDKQEADASKALSAEFAKLDANRDGKLSMTEFNNAKDLAAIKVDKNKAKGY